MNSTEWWEGANEATNCRQWAMKARKWECLWRPLDAAYEWKKKETPNKGFMARKQLQLHFSSRVMHFHLTSHTTSHTQPFSMHTLFPYSGSATMANSYWTAEPHWHGWVPPPLFFWPQYLRNRGLPPPEIVWVTFSIKIFISHLFGCRSTLSEILVQY